MRNTFRTDPGHPSSNYETGVRSNFNNVLWKTISWLIYLGSLVGIFYLNAVDSEIALFRSLLLWYGVSSVVLWIFFLTVLSFNQRIDESDPIAQVDNLEDGCFFYIAAIFGAPLILPYILAFTRFKTEYLNQFVFWRGKAWLFSSSKHKTVEEIESYNPLFWIWIMLFRAADEYDVQALKIDAYILKRQHEEEVALLNQPVDGNLLEAIRMNLQKIADEELSNDETYFFGVNGKANFVDYAVARLKDKGISKSFTMEKEAERIYESKVKKNL